MFDDLSSDVRCAWRSLARTPAFTIVAVLILGAGIAATTALFRVLDQAVLRPLPYPDPARLTVVHEVVPESVTPRSPVSAAHFEQWRTATASFEQMALLLPVRLTLGGGSEPELIGGARASSSLFRMLGMRMLRGRMFTADEDEAGHDRVAVLSHGLWLRRFAGDARAIGQPIVLDGEPYTVIGVLAPGVDLSNVSLLYPMTVTADRPQVWVPLDLRPPERIPGQGFKFACLARLRPHASTAQAASELNALQREIGGRLPGGAKLQASVVPLHEQLTGASRRGLELLVATGAVVLLVACVNIASLCVSRAFTRRRELAVIHALGADCGRLLRQLLAENVTVAAAGGLLGAAASPVLIRLIVATAPVHLARVEEVALDGRVLLFAAIVTVMCAVAIGVLPAWQSSHVALDALRPASNGGSGRSERTLGSLLVALEAGASTACVVVAGLLAVSLTHALNADVGYDRRHVLAGELRLPASRYDRERASTFLLRLREAIESLPGVVAAGISDRVPLRGEGGNSPIAPEGTNLPRLRRPVASLQLADGAYFRTMGIPVVSGRVFEEADRRRSPVAVISRFAAERIWTGQNPIGRRFRIGADASAPIEIIGIVGDVRSVSLESGPRPSVYLPYWHTFVGQASLIVRSDGEPGAIAAVVRDAIERLDGQVAPPPFESIETIVSRSAVTRRFQVNLAVLLAVTALALTCLGLYTTLNTTTRRRTREIALRIALGARPAEIRSMILRQALTPVAAGMGAGFTAALVGAPLLRGLLFRVAPHDSRVFAIAALALGAVSLLTVYVPVRRAARVEAMAVLRCE